MMPHLAADEKKGAVDPHGMQDNGEVSSDRDQGALAPLRARQADAVKPQKKTQPRMTGYAVKAVAKQSAKPPNPIDKCQLA